MAMRYLFVLNHALYLRNYGGVLLALSEAGHDIDVTFTASRTGDAELFHRVFAGRDNVRLLPPPVRTGWWWAAADPLRALRDYVHYLQPAFDKAPRLVDRASRRVPRLFRAIAGKRRQFGVAAAPLRTAPRLSRTDDPRRSRRLGLACRASRRRSAAEPAHRIHL